MPCGHTHRISPRVGYGWGARSAAATSDSPEVSSVQRDRIQLLVEGDAPGKVPAM